MVFRICNKQAITSSAPAQTDANAVGSPDLGNPSNLAIAIIVDGACTITVNVSYDGENWIPANYRNTATAATKTFTGAGSAVFDITPAPYVQLATNQNVNLSAIAYGS